MFEKQSQSKCQQLKTWNSEPEKKRKKIQKFSQFSDQPEVWPKLANLSFNFEKKSKKREKMDVNSPRKWIKSQDVVQEGTTEWTLNDV